MTTDGKYIVFKQSDFRPYLDNTFKAMACDDAVVIRRRDIFAPPALDAYSNAIMVAIQGIKAAVGQGNALADPDMIRDLQNIADYFHEQAVEAWTTERKLPS